MLKEDIDRSKVCAQYIKFIKKFDITITAGNLPELSKLAIDEGVA